MDKLRVTSFYSPDYSGRNDGATLYVTNVLKQMPNIDFVRLCPYPDYPDYGTFDFHLWIDWGEDCFQEYLSDAIVCPKPNLYWVSDMHWSEKSFAYRAEKAKEFDIVCCYHRQFVEPLKKLLGHERVYWLPVAAEPCAYPYGIAAKKHDVCFIGHLNTTDRVDTLDRVFRSVARPFWGKKLFEAAAEVYQESVIALNQSVKRDINMRTMEVPCAGGCLLTEDLTENGLGELFEIGKEIATYRTVEEAMEKIQYFLDHEEERDAVALAGHQRVMKDHTYQHRVNTMFDLARQHGLIKEFVHA